MWDKKHYREIKKFTLYQLQHKDFRTTINCPFEWAETFLPLLNYCISVEDYEGAQAMKDAIMDFLNDFLIEKITKKDLLKLPTETVSINYFKS